MKYLLQYGVEVMRLLLFRGSICSELYDLAAREYALHVRNTRATVFRIFMYAIMQTRADMAEYKLK